ncbi:MAG: glutamate--tRNA ligase [Alphaproteobacteria bacterium]|nr:glutamate--tRNA ligase [Alphaproteobacteria bacterium]
MTPKVRFAPSPTGLVHIGNVRTALLNYLFALKSGGQFLLRFDDTDTERSREDYVEAIREDLNWLGLKWDEEVRQSARLERYDLAAEKLREQGLLYACYETPDELDRRRRRQMARGLPPIYDRAGLRLTDEERAAFEKEGRVPHWRFRLPNTSGAEDLTPKPSPVEWADMIRGKVTVDLGSLSDPVLIRADGSYLYTFCSVVDDAELEITHILRGEDHVTNTGVQVALFEAIGAKAPVFGHHSLLVGADGKVLSKRLGDLSIRNMREAGLEAMAVASHGALIGTSDAIEPHLELDTLAELFDPGKISLAPGRFDDDELAALNSKLLHITPFADVRERLEAMNVGGGEDFWMAVRGNLERLSDAGDWWVVVDGELEGQEAGDNAEFLVQAAEELPAEPWDEATWGAWTKAVKAKTGAKGKALFHPLRLALTGRDRGPELNVLLPLIGREQVLKRLTG